VENLHLRYEVDRLRRRDMLAAAEHQRYMRSLGLDLESVLRRAFARRLALLQRAIASRRARVRVAPRHVMPTLVASIDTVPASAEPRGGCEDPAAA